MKKVYSFHISQLEKDAIMEIRKYNINVSQFLRMSLIGLERNLRLRNQDMTNNKDDSVERIKKNDQHNCLCWFR